MTQYRVTRKSIHRSRSHDDGAQTFEAGDVFEPTDAELDAFSDRLEAVEDDVSEEDDTEFSMDEWLDNDYEERVEQVEAGEVDDQLDTIMSEDTSNQVVDAAEERQEEFGVAYEEDEDDEDDEE